MDDEIDSMGRVLNYLRAHQRRGGTLRISSHKIAAAVDLSPKHVSRLRRLAIERGLLAPDGTGVEYRRIAVEESRPGTRWIPRTTCSWKGPIDWTARDGDGQSVSPKELSLRPRGDTWMVTFDSWEPVTTSYPPRLGPGVIAYVRPLKDPTDVRVGDWCLAWFGGTYVMSAFRVPGGFRRALDLHWKQPVLETDLVVHVAVIDAVHIPCTRRQNKIRLQAQETVAVIVDSPLPHFANRQRVGVINVDVAKLRRVLKRRKRRSRSRGA